MAWMVKAPPVLPVIFQCHFRIGGRWRWRLMGTKKKKERNDFVNVWRCVRSRKDAHQGQVPSRLHRPPAAGTGERVPLQSIHHHPAQIGAGQRPRTIRTTGNHLILFPISKMDVSNWFMMESMIHHETRAILFLIGCCHYHYYSCYYYFFGIFRWKSGSRTGELRRGSRWRSAKRCSIKRNWTSIRTASTRNPSHPPEHSRFPWATWTNRSTPNQTFLVSNKDE